MMENGKGSVPQSGRGAFFSGFFGEREDAPAVDGAAENIASGGDTENVPPDGVDGGTDAPPLCLLCGEDGTGFGSFPIVGGRLCGGCAGKLSEWFRCAPETTAEEIAAQLAYREANRAAVRDFRTTKLLWTDPWVSLDGKAEQFSVTSQTGKGANPDVLSWGQILGCDLDIGEQRKELLRRDHTHFRPRRYEYRFEFWVRVLVNHPYFHEMRFRLHPRPVVVPDRNVAASTAGKVVKSPEYQRLRKGGESIRKALLEAREKFLAEEKARAGKEAAAEGTASAEEKAPAEEKALAEEKSLLEEKALAGKKSAHPAEKSSPFREISLI